MRRRKTNLEKKNALSGFVVPRKKKTGENLISGFQKRSKN